MGPAYFPPSSHLYQHPLLAESFGFLVLFGLFLNIVMVDAAEL